jgi:antitoxin component YwqK of YwqJK toxin-antitoxin module/Tfp pilus assembly protein PilF
MKKTFSIYLIFFSFLLLSAQKDYTLIYQSDSIIKKGVVLHNEKKYDEAIKEYKKIRRIDPKYLGTQYEIAMSLSASEKKEELRTLFENLYKENQLKDFPSLYTLYGSFLSDEKEYDKSEKIFKEGEKYLSNSSNFLYNFAILYIRKEENQKSIDYLERSIASNPYHASSHYFLGLMALDEGRITEGTLALYTYLMLAPTGRYSKNAIQKLNAKYGENYLQKGKLIFSKSGDNFEEIETILRNQLPLKKAYKVKSEIDDIIIRQVQAVTEYAAEHKVEDGFFETTYIPWMKTLISKNQFESSSYYMLLGIEESLGKKLTSHKKEITNFYQQFVINDFPLVFTKRNIEHFGKKQEVNVINKNGVPYVIGKIVDSKKEGSFKYLDDNGNLKGELNLKNDELDGIQKYYDEKGNITEEKIFSNGKLNGTRKEYYSNGNLSVVENYKEDKLEGLSTSYYINGGKQCELNFINGERNGNLNCFYENGLKKTVATYLTGKLNGTYTTYNAIGDIDINCSYKNDELDGKLTQFYDSKKIKIDATYLNGKIQGSHKTYFPNGTLQKEAFYENGKLKRILEYYATGKISEESLYDDKEQIDSYAFFDVNGEKYFEEKYKSNELKYGLQFSKSNSKPIELTLTKKPFIVYDLNGKLLIKGQFEKGKKTGLWEFYYQNGVTKIKENFIQGKLEGLKYSYNRNGTLNTISNYVNNELNGLYEAYDNGILISEFYFVNGSKNGPYTNYNHNGTINTEGFYTDNQFNSAKITYYYEGKALRKSIFEDDVVISSDVFNLNGEKDFSIDYKNRTGNFSNTYYGGIYTENYAMINGNFNGKYNSKDKLNSPIIDCEFSNGIRNNNYKYYSPLGTIFIENNYYNGDINGTSKNYDLVGNLKLTSESLFGDDYGKTTRYYNNKSKMLEYQELENTIEGEYKYFNQKGENILTVFYSNNVPKYYLKLNKTGELTDKVEIVNETAEIISNYPNGKKAIQLNFNKGNKEGLLGIYNSEGKPELESDYTNNLLNGKRTEYYPNGKVFKIERFADDNYEGIQEYFKEDGKKWISAEYKNDDLNGNFLIYTNGVLTSTKKYDADELVEIK